MKNRKLFQKVILLAFAGVPLVWASVPRNSKSVDDVAVYQNLSEIKVKKAKSINFDSDIQHLSAIEKSYRKPIALEVSAPLDRVIKTQYKPGNSKKNTLTK